MKKITLPLLLLVLTTSAYSQATKYVCIPCAMECDTKIFEQGGKCPDCKMNLQEQGTINLRWGSLSPDGKSLLFTSDVKGKEFLFISDRKGKNPREINEGSAPQWSPDGKKILFSRNGAFIVMDVEGNKELVITEKFSGESPQTPTWGADNQTIFFAQGKFPNINLFRLSLDDYRFVELTNSPGLKYAPAVSPDGEKIVYAAMQKGIMLLEENHEPISLAPSGEYARWSPDGTQIAYQSREKGKFVIQVMDADGKNSKKLTDGVADDELPQWSPDGKKIYFQSNRRHGNWELYVMNADGTNQKLLLGNNYK